MATRSKVREAARSQATRSGRVPQSAIDEQLKSFDDKNLRLRSAGIARFKTTYDGSTL